jgi:hypothetical protein
VTEAGAKIALALIMVAIVAGAVLLFRWQAQGSGQHGI